MYLVTFEILWNLYHIKIVHSDIMIVSKYFNVFLQFRTLSFSVSTRPLKYSIGLNNLLLESEIHLAGLMSEHRIFHLQE